MEGEAHQVSHHGMRKRGGWRWNCKAESSSGICRNFFRRQLDGTMAGTPDLSLRVLGKQIQILNCFNPPLSLGLWALAPQAELGDSGCFSFSLLLSFCSPSLFNYPFSWTAHLTLAYSVVRTPFAYQRHSPGVVFLLQLLPTDRPT